jgi:hypothetical protein
MAAKRERSELDTSKLLDLLLRLAGSDQQVGSLGAGGRQPWSPAALPPARACLCLSPLWQVKRGGGGGRVDALLTRVSAARPCRLAPPLVPQFALMDRISNLMWDIVMAPGASRAIVETGSHLLAKAALEYQQHTGQTAALLLLAVRCLGELRERRNHVAALRALVAVMGNWPDDATRVRALLSGGLPRAAPRFCRGSGNAQRT